MRRIEPAGGVVLGPDNRVVVVAQQSSSWWSLPKGHIDPEEHPVETARREIHEEAGVVQLDLVQELGPYERWRTGQDGSAHEHELKTIHMFLFEPRSPISDRRTRTIPKRGVRPEDVPALLTHPVDAEFVERLLPQLSSEGRR